MTTQPELAVPKSWYGWRQKAGSRGGTPHKTRLSHKLSNVDVTAYCRGRVIVMRAQPKLDEQDELAWKGGLTGSSAYACWLIVQMHRDQLGYPRSTSPGRSGEGARTDSSHACHVHVVRGSSRAVLLGRETVEIWQRPAVACVSSPIKNPPANRNAVRDLVLMPTGGVRCRDASTVVQPGSRNLASAWPGPRYGCQGTSLSDTGHLRSFAQISSW